MPDISIIQLSVEKLKNLVSEAIQNELANLSLNKISQSSNEYLTREETAELLRITLPTLDKYTKKGIVEGYRLGTLVRYKRAEVETSLIQIQTNKYRRNNK